MSPHLLLVEDDGTIGTSLQHALSAQGYRVDLALDAEAARERFRHDPPDLVLLDLGLPDADGVDVCREFRAAGPGVAILLLTARQEEADVVVGLDAGADDYVTKPFRLAELLARIRAHLRRPEIEPAPERSALVVGDLRVEVAPRRAWVGMQELTLRPREFDLLALLAEHAGVVLTRERIMTEVWDEHWFGSTKTLDVHVSALRRKLGQLDGPGTPTITALPRVGYRLDALA
jgi:DNA-binding response OmpR family regulator